MKELTQTEFEQQVERVVNGELSRKELSKELGITLRTFYKKINEMQAINPNLYDRYIEKFPYRPKKREDIDFEALVIEMIKTGKNKQEMTDKYGVSLRTISRKVKELEKTNPRLVKLYRIHADDVKRNKNSLQSYREEIEQLPSKTVIIDEITGKKEKTLRETIDQFEKLVEQGYSKNAAAKELGYSGNPAIWKKYQEMERIDTEKKSKSEEFRNSMKISSTKSNNEPNEIHENETEAAIEEIEGR